MGLSGAYLAALGVLMGHQLPCAGHPSRALPRHRDVRSRRTNHYDYVSASNYHNQVRKSEGEREPGTTRIDRK